MFFPYRIETLFKHWPVANWVIMGLTALMFLASLGFSDEAIDTLILGGGSALGLFGHMFLHAGFMHLVGNLLFLWVFGNAVCAMMGSAAYLFLYFLFGLLAAVTHLVLDGATAVGASGAVNGVIGMAFAMYPRNDVSIFWFFFMRAGTFTIPLWVLTLFWFALDAYGAWRGTGRVAYWAHLGGFFTGAAAGMIGLKLGWLTLTAYDNATLADLFKSKPRRPKDTKWSWDEPMRLDDQDKR